MSGSPEKLKTLPPENPVLVRLENVTKSFGSFQALDQVSLEILKGDIVGLLGPNGAGKTTAMRILSGYFPPTSGKVWIAGQDMSGQPEKVKKHVGYLPETVHLYGDMSVMEFLDFAVKVKGVPAAERSKRIEEILFQCGIWEVRRRLIGQLSKGYKQRVGFAQALAGDPEVLVLDEPTTGLDPEQIHKIRMLLRELGRTRTVLISTHILPEVSMVCDRVLIMNEGRVLADGSVEELAAGLVERQEVLLTTGDSTDGEILKMLERVTGIDQIHIQSTKAGKTTLKLVVSAGAEIGPVLTRLFVEKNIPLYELRISRLSLEEIFLRLVVQENPPAVAL